MKVRALLVLVCLSACACASSMSLAQLYNLQPVHPTAVTVRADSASEMDVVVAPQVSAQMAFLYRYIQETEFALCLQGRVTKQKIYVDAFTMARISGAGPSGVSFERCDVPAYVGVAHNHPPSATEPGKGMCYFSEMDRKVFARDKMARVDIVICGDGNRSSLHLSVKSRRDIY